MKKTEELGYAIRQARKSKGLTQQQLAAQAGLSRTTLNQLENGTFPDLGIRKILPLLEALGLELDLRPRERKPDLLRMAAMTASVSYKTPLGEDELLRILLTGKVPASKRPHMRTLLEEANPGLIEGLVAELAQWTRPGRIEKNLEKMTQDINGTT